MAQQIGNINNEEIRQSPNQGLTSQAVVFGAMTFIEQIKQAISYAIVNPIAMFLFVQRISLPQRWFPFQQQDLEQRIRLLRQLRENMDYISQRYPVQFTDSINSIDRLIRTLERAYRTTQSVRTAMAGLAAGSAYVLGRLEEAEEMGPQLFRYMPYVAQRENIQSGYVSQNVFQTTRDYSTIVTEKTLDIMAWKNLVKARYGSHVSNIAEDQYKNIHRYLRGKKGINEENIKKLSEALAVAQYSTGVDTRILETMFENYGAILGPEKILNLYEAIYRGSLTGAFGNMQGLEVSQLYIKQLQNLSNAIKYLDRSRRTSIMKTAPENILKFISFLGTSNAAPEHISQIVDFMYNFLTLGNEDLLRFFAYPGFANIKQRYNIPSDITIKNRLIELGTNEPIKYLKMLKDITDEINNIKGPIKEPLLKTLFGENAIENLNKISELFNNLNFNLSNYNERINRLNISNKNLSESIKDISKNSENVGRNLGNLYDTVSGVLNYVGIEISRNIPKPVAYSFQMASLLYPLLVPLMFRFGWGGIATSFAAGNVLEQILNNYQNEIRNFNIPTNQMVDLAILYSLIRGRNFQVMNERIGRTNFTVTQPPVTLLDARGNQIINNTRNTGSRASRIFNRAIGRNIPINFRTLGIASGIGASSLLYSLSSGDTSFGSILSNTAEGLGWGAGLSLLFSHPLLGIGVIAATEVSKYLGNYIANKRYENYLYNAIEQIRINSLNLYENEIENAKQKLGENLSPKQREDINNYIMDLQNKISLYKNKENFKKSMLSSINRVKLESGMQEKGYYSSQGVINTFIMNINNKDQQRGSGIIRYDNLNNMVVADLTIVQTSTVG